MIKRIIDKIDKYFFIKKNLKIGENTRILTKINNFGSEPYLVEIGNNCTVTSGVCFITHDASIEVPLRVRKIDRVNSEGKYERMKKIKVKDNCVIGLNSIILPGVTIGPDSIVGAGSIVTKDVPPGTLVGGNPARVLGNVDDYYVKIKNEIIRIDHKKNSEDRKNEILNKFQV